jgi:hypothetical protein
MVIPDVKKPAEMIKETEQGTREIPLQVRHRG